LNLFLAILLDGFSNNEEIGEIIKNNEEDE
jgi:hypothetical protein